ncbi:GAF and ANTAR domain-containing protein [Rhodococcus sp. BP-349]|uniref:GAF and ANTAR domain-containing protein n=1 Tax=unclassified Rhodococcus (in: high G+C Gram-positive bacteria) TaxID=192944 RepID=UPI001C9ABDF4|nr:MULTISPECIES: GAF and ANTAR domain-containing protein [unclassified Rhodococcus (in: high G+C Gram-positive bacteria)]MBY6537447.1 GAF and ANTAR domain-containing protein [Rhodococcus sp. BP-363]MBY6541784.1 GAF and ANTAR domain-containing protein [Rhodococcus sp. BP-369]MBY6561014.1 GAF and ANTAR domain-containing protein [Rhodococcus sp. BP-370]MBY6575306.1 GAF and ANTAR domain-containing protein [Rhodococcus sp. BP-364]MBY6584607.1 GAF and ANTAR domain-containing protein [Rhodococcus sp.
MNASREPQPSDIASALAAFARDLTSHADLDDTLRRVTEAALDLVPGTDAADVVAISGRSFTSHGPTSSLPPRLDAVQIEYGEGPCLDAATTTAVVRADDLTTETRWPTYSPIAVAEGVRSSLSFQLFTHRDTFGALNLFAFEPHAFTDDAIMVGEALATHAAIALTAGRVEDQLHSALASRDVIGQAKGMIMERFGVDAQQAFTLLTRLSQDSNTPISRLSVQLVGKGSESAP